jgi:hypothetical protein
MKDIRDRFCSLVFVVPDYRFRSSEFDSRRYHIASELVGLEGGSTQSHEDNCGRSWKKQRRLRLENRDYRWQVSVALSRQHLLTVKVCTSFAGHGGILLI